jgi:hypothetical protein
VTPLDTLKAGIKTAIVTAIVGLVLAISGLVNEINAWATDGDPVDWSIGTATLLTLGGALLVGILNALLRFIQVAGVPFLSKVIDKLLGAVPAYPEFGKAKEITLTATDLTTTVNPAPAHHPNGG